MRRWCGLFRRRKNIDASLSSTTTEQDSTSYCCSVLLTYHCAPIRFSNLIFLSLFRVSSFFDAFGGMGSFWFLSLIVCLLVGVMGRDDDMHNRVRIRFLMSSSWRTSLCEAARERTGSHFFRPTRHKKWRIQNGNTLLRLCIFTRVLPLILCYTYYNISGFQN